MFRKAITLFVLVGCLSGCNSQDGSAAKLAPLSGRVTFKNKAVNAAEIFFMPDANKGNQGEMGTAIIGNEDGTFTLMTNTGKGSKEGVAPGAYKVVMTFGRRPDKELKKYNNVATTPLEINVPEEGFTDVVIDLDKGKIETK